ncbi:MAG: hypothetical protein JO340_02125 [Acidobacteriaceae bacterium]|nr:hypothetical protein [Acidobacteriaceae bacterium]
MSYDTRLATPGTSPLGRRWALAFLILALACFRLCHLRLLWADEDYHLAAAIHLLHGKIPYRDFWYDKPPLCAVYYLFIGGFAGWPLRLFDAAYVCLACWLIYRLARSLWTEAEGSAAALLLAFFLAFYLPSAVIPFAADAILLVPHLAAVYYAQAKSPFRAGLYGGIGFLANTKALFVLASCALFLPSGIPLLLLGFAAPAVLAWIGALATGATAGYYEQVWRWGLIYAAQSPVTRPLVNGIVRTADWLGFHAAIGAGAVFAFVRLPTAERAKLGAWLALSFAAAAIGWRFAPHYFLQVLPALVVLAARGAVLALHQFRKVAAVALALLLLAPFIRFGPRYAMLAYDAILKREPHWIDVGMDLDSQEVSRKILAVRRPGDTLFVWGYRPDVYVYTRMISDGLFWDSQPLTGVPADRHLHAQDAIYGGPAALNRQKLTRTKPAYLVDGLGLLNPRLAPENYSDLQPWLAHYKLIARTKLSLIYRRTY